MFKNKGLVVILFMFACLANCANTPIDSKSDHLNQPKGENMIVTNTEIQPKTTHFENKT